MMTLTMKQIIMLVVAAFLFGADLAAVIFYTLGYSRGTKYVLKRMEEESAKAKFT